MFILFSIFVTTVINSAYAATQCFTAHGGNMTCVDDGYNTTHLFVAAIVFAAWFVYHQHTHDVMNTTANNQVTNGNINQLRREFAEVEKTLAEENKEQIRELRTKVLEKCDLTNANVVESFKHLKMLVDYFNALENARQQQQMAMQGGNPVAANNPPPGQSVRTAPTDNIKVEGPPSKEAIQAIVKKYTDTANESPVPPQPSGEKQQSRKGK